MRKLIIRVDSTPTIGMGHAYRTAALVESLRDAFDPVICGHDEKLTKAFPAISFAPLEEALADPQAVVLIDHPYGLKALPPCSHPKIIIDDFGGIAEGDLILNGTVTAHAGLYPQIADPQKLLLGPAYTLLRPAFSEVAAIERKALAFEAEQREQKLSFLERVKNYFSPPQKPANFRLQRLQPKKKFDVLLIAGSGLAAKNWMSEMTQQLAQWNIAIVVGAQFEGVTEYGHVPFFQNITAEKMAELMHQSKMALVTGGMIVYECLASGIATVAYPSEGNMVPEISRLEDWGIIDNIGNIKDKPQHLRSLLMNKDYLRIRAEKGIKLVDGLGSKRAANIIKNRFA